MRGYYTVFDMELQRVGFAGTTVTNDVNWTFVWVVVWSGVALMISIIFSLLFIICRRKTIEMSDDNYRNVS